MDRGTGISEIERKAALAMFPYFSKSPVVFDVGSNKGYWADILVHNVRSMILFEPNENLLTYTRVKYDYLKNVDYIDRAIWSVREGIYLTYFVNENNGLSNVLNNSRWDSLPHDSRLVQGITLDSLIPAYILIDLIKIDVEGADFHALMGAKESLASKRIRFIQFENSEHLALAGHSLDMIIDYVRPLGYDVFHFTGEVFTKELDRTAENLYIMDTNFSQGWNKEFIENTKGIKVLFALEIGCFEGLTSRYICDNLLLPNGRMICIDPLTDEYLPGHKDNEMFVGQFERFTRNTNNYPVELVRKKSSEILPSDDFMHYRFGLIYVDGDHREGAVYNDARLAFHLCLKAGYILFDDYDGYDEGTTRGINRWLNEMPPKKFTVVKRGYQLMIQKHENLD